ncbi:hypothetical protein BV898_09947 [Hypsibius exemplaris]|uniref:Transposase Tc1-like domain-containing protein n=1 Tax=Hypsibius exemplaris TaxID=2072580 RepID=A0A1W0WKV9_HYPEX|nr:hypothetical protein BV898_09947 [Hypsibius exemplaris]
MPTGKVLSQDAVDMIRYMHEVHKLTYSKIGELIGRPKGYIGRVIESVDPVTGLRKIGKKGRHVKTTDAHDQRIRELALANPFIGCEALTKLYNDEADLHLSKSSVHRRLKSVGVEVVKVAANTDDLQDKKTFPKSQTVWKFVLIQEKKKRVTKKKGIVLPASLGREGTAAEAAVGVGESLPEALPVTATIQHEMPMPVHTINILIDPSLGIPQIMQFG